MWRRWDKFGKMLIQRINGKDPGGSPTLGFCFPNYGPVWGSAAKAAPESLGEMQNLTLHRRPRMKIYILKDANLFLCILKFKFKKSSFR